MRPSNRERKLSEPRPLPRPAPTKDAGAALRADLEAAPEPIALLRRAQRHFGSRLAVAVSFGPEDMVLVELVRQLFAEGQAPQIRLITIDTGRLPELTHQLLERVRLSLKLKVEVFVPQSAAIQTLLNAKGPLSFYDSIENRRECCSLRKVEPLTRALSGLDAWVTGQRSEQALTRQGLSQVEEDTVNGARVGHTLLKLNPLAALSEADVWEFLDENRVPTHRLHEEGYPSVGCAPCTRAVAGWQRGAAHAVDVRAGRWWWESAEHKECGLHAGQPPPEDENLQPGSPTHAFTEHATGDPETAPATLENHDVT